MGRTLKSFLVCFSLPSNLIKMKSMLLVALFVAVAAAYPHELDAEYKEPIAITKYGSVSDGTGKYSYNFEAANGIKMSEQGEQKYFGDKEEESYGSVARGSYSYELDGVTYTINWVADENGFQPTGNHLPVAPPMPEYVVKMLADLRAAGKLE